MGISRLRSHGKIKPEIGANRGAYSDRMSGNEFALPDELEQPLGNGREAPFPDLRTCTWSGRVALQVNEPQQAMA